MPGDFDISHDEEDVESDDTEGVVVKSVEAWATAKGHTGANAWKFASAKAHKVWPVGFEVTESEYDTAVQEAGDVSLGYPQKAPK